MPPTRVTCPNGHTVTLPVNLSGLVLEGNGVANLEVTCHECHVTFDAAPIDGTYATASDGSLHRVADYLAGADAEELAQLKREIENLKASPDQRAALALAEKVGWRPPNAPAEVPLRTVIKERADAANALLTFLLRLAAVIGTIQLARHMTPDEIRDFVLQFLR